MRSCLSSYDLHCSMDAKVQAALKSILLEVRPRTRKKETQRARQPSETFLELLLQAHHTKLACSKGILKGHTVIGVV